MPGAPHASSPQLARALGASANWRPRPAPVMEFLHEPTRDTSSISGCWPTDGMLLQTLGDPQFLGRAERVALRVGATLAEQFRGTNAIGTALTESRAMVVHADEHYLERNGFLTCAAAPSLDPRGPLLQCAGRVGRSPGLPPPLGLRSAARVIEHRLFDTVTTTPLERPAFAPAHPARGIGTVAEGLLASDRRRPPGRRQCTSALDLAGSGLGKPAYTTLATGDRRALCAFAGMGPAPAPGTRGAHRAKPPRPWLRVEAAPWHPCVPVRTGGNHRHTPWSIGPRSGCAGRAGHGRRGVCRCRIARARKLAGKPIALLFKGRSGWARRCLPTPYHQSGPRAARPLAVNCAALPEHLIEAELFGYQGGAFTGARREGSRGRIPRGRWRHAVSGRNRRHAPAAAGTLAARVAGRVVGAAGRGQPVPVDFSLICATHRDLPTEMQAGRFREDLYYRLNGLTLRLPPLRERTDLQALMERELHQLVRTPVRPGPDVE